MLPVRPNILDLGISDLVCSRSSADQDLAAGEPLVRSLLTLKTRVTAGLLDLMLGGKYLSSLLTRTHQHYGRLSLGASMTHCHFTGQPGS